MPRRKKNIDVISNNEEVKIEAPKVETTIIVGSPEIPNNENNKKEDIVNDIVIGDCDNKEIIEEYKNRLFEPSPTRTKTLVINKIIKKKPDIKRIGQIKANLTQRPMISSYRGTRTRKTNNFNLSFKVGR
jgi:hypothetical protein